MLSNLVYRFEENFNSICVYLKKKKLSQKETKGNKTANVRKNAANQTSLSTKTPSDVEYLKEGNLLPLLFENT